jgi:hypothetical protein
VKVLLDECVDARFAAHLAGLEALTVHDLGWGGITNGRLLALAQSRFDVFVTVDRNLSFQQHLPKYSLAVVLIHARSNRLVDLLPHVPALLEAIPAAERGTVTHVGHPR